MEVIEALKQLQQGNIPLLDHGICGNLDEILDKDMDDIIVPHFRTWEHYSGNSYFPIPDPSGEVGEYVIYDEYFLTGTLWQGEYGKLRMDLVNHLIKELENEERNTRSTETVTTR